MVYFQRSLQANSRQRKLFQKATTVSERAQLSSYEVAEFIALKSSLMSLRNQWFFQCCDRKSRVACGQSFAPWQQATIEFMRRNLSYFIESFFILLRLNPLGQRKLRIVISLSRMLCFGRVCASPCALNVSATLQSAYKFDKHPMVYSVSCFYLGGLALCLVGLSHTPSGDGTATGVPRNFYSLETVPPCKKVWEPLP